MIEKIDTVNDITHSMSPLRRELNEKLFDELVGVMNEVHESDYSDRFWLLLLRGHVRAMISRVELLNKERIDVKPDMYSINGRSFPGVKEKLVSGIILVVKHLKTRRNRVNIDGLLESDHVFRFGFPEFDGLVDENIGVELPIYYPLITGFGDKRRRGKVNHIAKRYDDPFLGNVVAHLPKIVVEHFQEMYDSIKLVVPEKKKFHVHNAYSFHNQMLIAKYVDNGAELYWYQHGSFYGEFEGDSSHHFEHSVSDEFRTWGWKIKKKDVPWKAYRLEWFRQEYNKYPDNREYDLLLAFPKMKKKTKKLYVNFTKDLLKNLDKDKYSRLLARPRPLNKVVSYKSELSFIEDERVDKNTGRSHMAEDMSKCRIVLQLSVPGTNFLECIYMDHITIGLLQNDQPTDIIKPYYDFFLEKGVLHRDAESLVAHMNKIDPESWWQSVMANPMYKSFKETFTRRVR